MSIRNRKFAAGFIIFLLSFSAWALEPTPVATLPIAPPQNGENPLFKPDIFCSRTFTYKERTYPLDSNRKQDGDGLRAIFKQGSPSELMLNDYQQIRKGLKWPAYIGSMGVAILVAGSIYAGNVDDKVTQRTIRYGSILSGALVIMGAYFYSQAKLTENEKLLENAIGTYNNTAPATDQIHLGVEVSF